MLLDATRFEDEVLGSAEPVLVDFFGAWCEPCRKLAPTLDKLAGEGHRVCKVNVEAHPDLTGRYRVGGLPTLVVVKGGEEVARFAGLQSERTLRDVLSRAGMAAPGLAG
jgi:thioredoxin 1